MATERSRGSDLAAWVGTKLRTNAWTSVVLGADVSSTSATVDTDVTGLSLLLPSGLWEVRGKLLVQAAAATTGPQVGLAWTAGTVAAMITAPSAAATVVLSNLAAAGRAANTGLPTAGASYLVTIEGTARISSTLAAPGLRPTLRSEVAGSAVTIKVDSWMAYRRVA